MTCRRLNAGGGALQGSDQIRQAFSKRKKGLVLKAYQLSALTDAKVRCVTLLFSVAAAAWCSVYAEQQLAWRHATCSARLQIQLHVSGGCHRHLMQCVCCLCLCHTYATWQPCCVLTDLQPLPGMLAALPGLHVHSK